jgi:hypothetical protein
MGYRGVPARRREIARILILVISIVALFSETTGALASKGGSATAEKKRGKRHGHAAPGQGHDHGRATRGPGKDHGRRDHRPPGEAYPHAPNATASRYMTHTSGRRSSTLGCWLGSRVRKGLQTRDGLVILDYGMPMHHRGAFGASVFGSFRDTRAIRWSVEQYARGYARCVRKGGSHLEIGIGTTNFGPDVTYRHGRIWAQMVNHVNWWLRRHRLASRVDAAGANDIEPGWRGPEVTRRWVRGYRSATSIPYYNYGGAAGCPPYPACQGGWTMEDVWWVSWGSGVAIPLPEIYAGSGVNAEQWYRLSLYSVHEHGERMHFAGAMSQLRSCAVKHDACRGVRNRPEKAWSQLHHALNRDPRTAQPLRWATDITWEN